MIDIFLW